MKRFLFFSLLIGLSACEFYYVEPRYDHRDKIVGSHQVEEYSETYNDYTYYSIQIGRLGQYGDEIFIDNFYGVGIRVCALYANGKITIHRQTINGYEVEGVGTVYSHDIEFHYSVRDKYANTRTDYCEALAWRE
jgi:hypothetical protein